MSSPRFAALATSFAMFATALSGAPTQELNSWQSAAVSIPSATMPSIIAQGGAVERVLFKRRKLQKTSICGDADIQGEEVGSVAGKLPGCGAQNAVRVRSVAGVSLSQPAVMTCETASALSHWVEKGVQPAFRKRVVALRVAAHYSCRTRNNRPGAKISEHGRGKAIDISGFQLKNGEMVTVLQGWKKRSTRKKLHKAWKAACGPFGTVLGPQADRYHQDHFHLDTARHRSGAYCR